MAPKKEAPAPTEPPAEEEPPKETIKIDIQVGQVSNLPAELATCVIAEGFPEAPVVSEKEEASRQPGPFVFPQPTLHFPKAADNASGYRAMLDRVCSKMLTIRLVDTTEGTAAEQCPEVGRLSVDLIPLLHTSKDVTGRFQLELTEKYDALFDKPAAVEGENADQNAEEGDKGEEEAEAAPAEEVDRSVWVDVTLVASELLAPPEDKGDWNAMTVRIEGVYALPPALSAFGTSVTNNVLDATNHPFDYTVHLLGMHISEGALVQPPPPPEEPPAPGAAEGAGDEGEEAAAAEPVQETPEMFYEKTEKAEVRVFWEDPAAPSGGDEAKHPVERTAYNGRKYLRSFKTMLDKQGGVWAYFVPSGKPSIMEADVKAKKGAPVVDKEAILEACNRYCGKAWIDLRRFQRRATKEVSGRYALTSFKLTPPPEEPPAEQPSDGEGAEQPTEPKEAPESLEKHRTYLKVTVSFLTGVLPLEPRSPPPLPQDFLPARPLPPPLKTSEEAAEFFKAVIENGIDMVGREFEKLDILQQKTAPHSVELRQGFLEHLRSVGVYQQMQNNLREAMVKIVREKVQKQPDAVPQLSGGISLDARDKFYSELFVYMTDSLHRTVNRRIREEQRGKEELQWKHPITREDRRSDPSKEMPTERLRRLIFECETKRDYERAAKLYQNLCVAEADDPVQSASTWYHYARFCFRTGRTDAGEEALKEAICVAGGESSAPKDVLRMLGAALMATGRYEGAVHFLSTVLQRERGGHGDVTSRPTYFLLALAYFMDGQYELGEKYLTLSTKDAAYFEDEEEFDQGPRLFVTPPEAPATDTDVSPTSVATSREEYPAFEDPATGHPAEAEQEMCILEGLDLLLAYEIPQPAIEVIDRDDLGLLSLTSRASERVKKIKIKALMLLNEYAVAADHLREELDRNDRQQEVWMLYGECLLRTNNRARALEAFQHCLEFCEELTDPLVYLRAGQLLLGYGHFKTAKSRFLQSLEIQATAEAWYGAGKSCYLLEDYEGARECLCEANYLDNEHPQVWGFLCLVAIKTDRPHEADQCFKYAMQWQLGEADVLIAIGREYIQKGVSGHLAESALRKAVQLQDSGYARLFLAQALALQDLYEKAVLEAQVAIGQAYDQPELLEVAATKALEYADYLQDHQLREAIEMAYQMSVKRREEEEAAKLEGGPGSEYGGRDSFFSDRVSIPGFSDSM
ncbi:unnamed protein product [Vitrella brassicaformis CCMP3155]|uniref:Uncharacterized protein n=2 Tax=Vitrella brassicaformis TaxID=1169539 RepID=A0A0G4G761_VITBC|nr:unnamed protein product [Vitrella brassicaformis CCMP3155]|mmetsp:Transcript_36492/g.91291  ORF Transcript_36492/g.91291 Transcript_36492/m.91291 type:complete len:1198 (+) Transcript_36492:25-3618(+)|eukprot:CEM24461.1 unnamed protein product [Vitrella brassicaformis CCMP3155]